MFENVDRPTDQRYLSLFRIKLAFHENNCQMEERLNS